MFKAMVVSLAFVGAWVHAEEKTCAVSGVHCQDCVQTVQDKVCEPGKYAKCHVAITDKKNEMGEINLATKKSSDKIDEKSLGDIVKDAGGYSLGKCSKGSPKAASKAS